MSIITRVDLLKRRRTKIVATVGPASESAEMIASLIETGVDVFRLNMSHGDHAFHEQTCRRIREEAERAGKAVAVLADLCGPKIRTGKFRNGEISLSSGQNVTVTTRDVEGEDGLIPSQYRALADDVNNGDRILLDDGSLELRVEQVKSTEIICTVIHGGVLKNHKGINLPGVRVSAPSLTDKDTVDALFAMQMGVDFLALSFVRSAEDVMQLKELIRDNDGSCLVVSKIEKPEALENAREIISATDAVMVARGDLGVELQAEEVPVAQRELIELARAHFTPVIVATQMLESMISNARPTRAEVTDIAYAVTLNTDAVMLSAETAAGRYPLESVRMMDRIARQTEAHLWKSGTYGRTLQQFEDNRAIWSVIANATTSMSRDLMAHAVMVISQSGMSALTMSSARPAAPVVALTGSASVCRRMALMWSVIPVLAEQAGQTNPNELAKKTARELGLGESGDYILLVRGFSSDPQRNNPSITALKL